MDKVIGDSERKLVEFVCDVIDSREPIYIIWIKWILYLRYTQLYIEEEQKDKKKVGHKNLPYDVIRYSLSQLWIWDMTGFDDP